MKEYIIKTVIIGCLEGSGLFDAYLVDEDDIIIEEYPNDGQEITWEIENATGQIRNWQPIETFKTKKL